MGDTEPTIHARLLAVQAAVGAITKARSNDQFRYRFRGIDDALNALHGPLVEHGVRLVPEFGAPVWAELSTSKGAPMHACTVRLDLHAEDATGARALVAATIGHAADTQDKAANKAMAAAAKYALFYGFTIPVDEASIPDGDADNPAHDEPARPDPLTDAKREMGRRLTEAIGDKDAARQFVARVIDREPAPGAADMTLAEVGAVLEALDDTDPGGDDE